MNVSSLFVCYLLLKAVVKKMPKSCCATGCSNHNMMNPLFIPSLIISVKVNQFIVFWPGLGLPRPKAIVVIPQNQPLPKHLRKKTSKSAKHACHYATKERPVKITMYLGLDIIIKIKFTTIFDRCAILNVLNYLTKNFES